MPDHKMGLKMYQLLVGHSFSLISIFVCVFLLDRTNFGSKVLLVGWCTHISTGDPVWLLELDSSGSMSQLLGYLAKVTCIDSWGPPLIWVSGTS